MRLHVFEGKVEIKIISLPEKRRYMEKRGDYAWFV